MRLEYSRARCPPTRAHLWGTLRDARRYQCLQKPAGLDRSPRRRLGGLESPSTGLRFKALNSYLSPGPFNTNPPINPLAPVVWTFFFGAVISCSPQSRFSVADRLVASQEFIQRSACSSPRRDVKLCHSISEHVLGRFVCPI